jgi:hypothetical protein
MNKLDSISCEALSLAKSRYRINAPEHFTAMELSNYIPMHIDTNLKEVKEACVKMVDNGFLEIWGRKYSSDAYRVKESILMESIALSEY